MLFLVARQGLAAFVLRAKYGVAAVETGDKPQSAGLWHMTVRVPGIKKADAPLGIRFFGGSPGTRTLDPRLKRALLYQLS